VEQVSFLRHKALHIAQVYRIDIGNVRAGKLHAAFLHIPKPHEQLQKRRFSAAAPPDDAHDRTFGNRQGYVIKNRIRTVGKGHMLGGCAVESNILFSGHFLHHRRFLKDIQNTVSRRKGILQGAAEIRKRHTGAEGAHQRNGRNQHAGEIYRAVLIQRCRYKQHRKVEDQDDGIRHRHIASCCALHPRLIL